MKTKIRLLALCLAVILLVPAMPFGTSAATTGAQSTDETRYTKNKVVSVLFDNSGSMKNDGGTVYRWEYAKYALQTLMTMLSKNDTLVITPMNIPSAGYGSPVTSTSAGVVVDLAAENREDEINRVLTATFLGNAPAGTTPPDTIKIAVEQLTARGMKKTTEISANEKSENEYFLLVLTDGVFDGLPHLSNEQAKIDGAAKFFTGEARVVNIDEYAFLQTLYIGFDVNALDLGKAPALQGKTNFTAYKAPDTASIGGVMRDVANKITGRYPLDVRVEGKTVHIPLDGVNFGLRSVTLMATNTNARYKSASYGGAGVAVTQNVQFGGFVATSDIKMSGGFNATLARGGGATFSGGEITVELTEAPDANAVISVLLEPAIRLEPVVLTAPGGDEIDSAYINTKLGDGDLIYVDYRLVEEGTNRVLTEAELGSAVATVSYNTLVYDPMAPITLSEGRNEIGISVSLMNGQYNLYTSIPCLVRKVASYFRLVPGTVRATTHTLYEIPFTVYDNNQPLTSASELAKYDITLRADATAKGTPHVSKQLNADGTITVRLDVSGCDYDTYNVYLELNNDGDICYETVPVGYYPSGLALTVTGPATMSKTLFGVIDNKDAFTFALTAGETDPVDLPFRNALVDYTLTVNGTDLTDQTSVSGNVLSFVPTASALGDLAKSTGDLKIKLSATFRGLSVETKEAEVTLSLTPIIYEILPLPVSGSVDRFSLGDNETSVYFRVLRDGVALPADLLQAAIDNGEITASDFSILLPVNVELTVEEKGGEPTVRARFAGGHFAPLRGLVTSMLLFTKDELPVTLSYQGVSAESAAPLPGAGPVPYIWRILLILYIIQLLIILFTLPGFNDAVKRVPQGTLVKVELKQGRKAGGKEKREIEAIAVKRKITLGDTLIPMRLLPFIGLLPPFWRKDISVPGVQMMTYDAQSDSVVLTCAQTTKGTFLVAPDGLAEWARKSSLGKSMDDDKFKRARVECEPKTTNESKKLSLTVSSGPVINDVLYVFVKRGR